MKNHINKELKNFTEEFIAEDIEFDGGKEDIEYYSYQSHDGIIKKCVNLYLPIFFDFSKKLGIVDTNDFSVNCYVEYDVITNEVQPLGVVIEPDTENVRHYYNRKLNEREKAIFKESMIAHFENVMDGGWKEVVKECQLIV